MGEFSLLICNKSFRKEIGVATYEFRNRKGALRENLNSIEESLKQNQRNGHEKACFYLFIIILFFITRVSENSS